MNASQGKVPALSWVHSIHKFSRCISCLFPPSNLTFFCPSGKWLICVSHTATNSVLQHENNSTACEQILCTTYLHRLTFSREFNSLYAVNLVCTQTANEVHLWSRGFTVHKSFIRKYVQKYGCPKTENGPNSNRIDCITWSSDFTDTQWYTARGAEF